MVSNGKKVKNFSRTQIKRRIFIRADANPRFGVGHVMRCLALAQIAAQKGFNVYLVGRISVPWLREYFVKENISFTELTDDIPDTEKSENLLAQLARSSPEKADAAGWIILDGYHFGPECHKAVHSAGYKLLVIDDYNHLPEYHCDILLNQNFGSEDFIYTGNIGHKLLGPKYALLRPDFASARTQAENRIFPEKVKNILLTLGGGDFSTYLDRIAPALAVPDLSDCTLRIIAGSMPETGIRAALRGCPASLEILRRVDDMPKLLLDTDLCITAAGSTCWELCCLGVPFLVHPVADNQQEIARWSILNGTAKSFNMDNIVSLMYDIEERRTLTDNAKTLTDGHGARNVVEALLGNC
jgi:UDP-2,4-diacetamido-2,4,6-trideoxy-beta-L-altropyranose hydrolase